MNTDQREKHGHISWGELCTTDIEAAKTFYNKLFGWEYQTLKSPAGMDYESASKDKDAVVGMMNLKDLPCEGMPPVWGIYITVDCIDTALQQTKDNGGSIVMEKTPLTCGAGAFAFIKDPQGATLGLFEYYTKSEE